MGFNSTVVVLNDALSQIERDPDFGKNLARAIMEVSRGKPVDVASVSGNSAHCNVATVIETHHADLYEVTAVGGNCGIRLGYTYYHEGDKIKMLRDLALQHHYRLVKIKFKKTGLR
jgi:hypothetical protein